MKNLRFLGILAISILAFSCTDELLTESQLEVVQLENDITQSRESGELTGISYSSSEIVLLYKEGTTLDQKINLRNKHAADIRQIKKCARCDDPLEDGCSPFEVWDLYVDPNEKKGVLSDGSGDDEEIIKAVEVNFSFESGPNTIVTDASFSGSNNTNIASLIANNRGIIIAFLDTGIDYGNAAVFGTKPFLHDTSDSKYPQLHSGFNFVNNTINVYDDSSNGHGTKTASVITEQLKKTPMDYELLPVKVLDKNGKGKYSDILCGLQFALREADVVNASLGWYGNANSTHPIFKSIISRYEQDKMIIASGGNDTSNNDGTAHYPSSFIHSNVLGIAASKNSYAENPNNDIADYSNYGMTSLDFFANGSVTHPALGGNLYPSPRGTSFAAARVTAIVAAYLDAMGTGPVTPFDVRNYLKNTGDPVLFSFSVSYDILLD
ncbi:S8 family serine peptidase [Flavobacteriaceae bacterium S356]|uniref:S8 family serine peptidase n=1 Tax=Asprobacillus argus TaxID=3076534 RepID=A0ABU3LJ39_9FLAO|nr:S8 family serine peptidase [Flavobacteriaceae bacterium S356]